MASDQKRIFISDLPETVTKDELESAFSNYGQVVSVEIKERKELGPIHKSLFFAYISLSIDDRALNDCFRDFKAKKWYGHYIQLQIARESFLERLKRERLENKVNQPENLNQSVSEALAPVKKINNTQVKPVNKTKPVVKPDSSSDSSDSDEEEPPKKLNEEPEEKLDMVIKNNRHKVLRGSALKIPSVGAKPIIEITKTKQKNGVKSEADVKRLQSVRDMKKNYEAKKSLIKNALAYGSAKLNNKIVFGSDENKSDEPKARQVNGHTKDSLFEEDSDDDFQANFEVKEQFDGSKGQKLLQLQSRYEADKRFALDKRFIENDEEETSNAVMETEMDIEEEKSKELKILGEVLGKEFVPKSAIPNSLTARKTMLKFDPSQPEHSSLIITPTPVANKTKKTKKEKHKEEEPMEIEKPEVSKEVFYKIPEKLKETFTETPSQFSLLSMFQRPEGETQKEEESSYQELKPNKSVLGQRNPYKYDSTDEEDEIEDIPHKEDLTKKNQETKTPDLVRSTQAVFWTEPFFFKPDDFRLQEGFDFIEKVKMDCKEFTKIRRDVKGIVKAKVKNSERKNKMFKKKLGGSKKRKHIRMKKALKR